MKLTSVEAFEKHLKEASPHYLSSVYGVVLSHPFERKSLIDFIIELKKKSIPQLSIEALSGERNTPQEFYEALMMPSFFSSSSLLIFDDVDELEKNILTDLLEKVKNIASSKSVILGMKRFFTSLDSLKKEIVLLDLSEEKPWDRKKRVLNLLRRFVQKQRKQIAPDTLEMLYDALNGDFEALENELEKLICLVGENPSIDRGAVHQITCVEKEFNAWKLAEDFVWGNQRDFPQFYDLNEIFPFLGQLRFQLEMGLKIALMKESSALRKDIENAFPKISAKALDRYMHASTQLKSVYFRRGLRLLLDLEIDLKNRSVKPPFLTTLFAAKFYAPTFT